MTGLSGLSGQLFGPLARRVDILGILGNPITFLDSATKDFGERLWDRYQNSILVRDRDLFTPKIERLPPIQGRHPDGWQECRVQNFFGNNTRHFDVTRLNQLRMCFLHDQSGFTTIARVEYAFVYEETQVALLFVRLREFQFRIVNLDMNDGTRFASHGCKKMSSPARLLYTAMHCTPKS
tara:strand:- start:6935 stop:7474 length:540 start_codon:yes stop_codon:yes gene_type:complete